MAANFYSILSLDFLRSLITPLCVASLPCTSTPCTPSPPSTLQRGPCTPPCSVGPATLHCTQVFCRAGCGAQVQCSQRQLAIFGWAATIGREHRVTRCRLVLASYWPQASLGGCRGEGCTSSLEGLDRPGSIAWIAWIGEICRCTNPCCSAAKGAAADRGVQCSTPPYSADGGRKYRSIYIKSK